MGLRIYRQIAPDQRLEGLWPDAVVVRSDHVAADAELWRGLTVRTWPREVAAGWALPVLLANEALTVSIVIAPVANDQQMAQMNRRLVWNRGAQRAAEGMGRIYDAGRLEAMEDADRLRRDLASGRVRMVRVGLAFLLRARTRDHLDRRTDGFMSLAASLMLLLGRGRYQQQAALAATMPGGEPIRGLRVMDTEAAATLFPLVGDDRHDPSGEMWGENSLSHSPVVVDRRRLPAPHSFTAAWSGAGKSFATKLQILRARYHGHRVVVIDPEGEYRGLCAPAGVMDIGEGRGLNPLFWAGSTAVERVRRGAFAIRWLEMLAGPLPPETRRTLLTHLDTGDALTPGRWLKRLARDLPREYERVGPYLHHWVSVIGEGETRVPDSGLSVIDLSAVPDALRAAAYLAAVEYVLATLSDRRPRWVVFDEAWRLLLHPDLAPYLEELYRRARKWHTTLVLVTQDANDALRSPAAEVCLRNSPLVLLLKPHPEALTDWARLFHLTMPEREWLAGAGVGEGLLLADRARLPIRIVASPRERALIQEAEAHARVG
ncbi:MAG: VirB4 family type IV secretion system protein [Clostridia bacterium]